MLVITFAILGVIVGYGIAWCHLWYFEEQRKAQLACYAQKLAAIKDKVSSYDVDKSGHVNTADLVELVDYIRNI